MQAAAVEIFRCLGIQVERLLAGFRDANELQEAGLIRIAILPKAVHFRPEPVHRGAAGLVAVVGQVAVDVVHFGAPTPGFDRSAAWHPDWRMRVLHRARPDVHVALLVEAAIEGEGVLLGPGAHHQVMRFVIALAQLAGLVP